MTTWRNWGRSASCVPAEVVAPVDEADLVETIQTTAKHGQSIRPVGAGHSFTSIAATDGIQLRLDHFSGIVTADRRSGLVTLLAGTRLRDLPPLLGAHGLAMENLGDVDPQTIAGAISTGTHGTGLRFTGIAGQVRGLRIALADGRVVDCSATERSDIFHAARLGLGAIGVLVHVTLQCVPAFALAAQEHPESLEEVIDGFAERAAHADHVEFYWFPHTDRALVKTNTRLPGDAPLAPVPKWRRLLDDEILTNGVFAVTCATGRVVPAVIPSINRIANRLVSSRAYTDHSADVFVSPRRVRFREMEYAIDLDVLPDTLRAIKSLLDDRGWRISFPLEVRCAVADDVWLSTAYGRTSAYIAVHRYYRESFREYFDAVEQILVAAGGRPHWGKLHTRSAADFEAAYPKYGEFLRVRAALDPGGLFTNDYLRRVLGPVSR
ncbi:L-gulonolactone oxidase [Antricoccus suffuscus]|uniref:L-gulonolactone oxidase n=1 Tax=Antricoccus suffuscus TaxID=1629062 RepID=A0A2T1A4J1_9ACTN|nr:D-arabinono-1,4-lactone oxidase [Antricoccus suffuscus]PRZ43464.1 L-gulonolactone oxidase [Antricoccus suffuscus]